MNNVFTNAKKQRRHFSNDIIINKSMENIYDDEKLTEAENFELMAKAYSKSLKNKGFVFVKLEEEEFSLLLDEVAIFFKKIVACMIRLRGEVDCSVLWDATEKQFKAFCDKFDIHKEYHFKSIESSEKSFLSLISLENHLTLKLMLLSMKSGELEFCHEIIVSRARIYADSFACEGFIVE